MRAAFELFDHQGFEATTINQIAERAGLSRSSFFRYFATKEDVVLLGIDERGLRLRDALAARPLDEAPWQSLHQALLTITADLMVNPERALRMSRMIAATPSLHARRLHREHTWQAMLAGELAQRLSPAPAGTPDPRPGALACAALGCHNAAEAAWQQSEGQADLHDLLDRAMSAITG